jgi:VanZ family protein
MIQVKKWQRLCTLFLYFGFICTLFFLPGSAFPKNDWFSKIWFDKWVHIGIFTVLTFLSGWAFSLKEKKALILLILAAVAYGFLVEIIQDRFIKNRSYDLGDLLADTIGSLSGSWFWNKRYIKK